MSDSWINIIPTDPQFVPGLQAQRQAVEFMRRIVGRADEVRCELSENVRFIDCGENLERILCPRCGREVSCEWWRDQMEYQFEHGYTLEPVPLPCCGAAVSLAELTYEWPQGYAKCSVEAMNPEVADLTSEQVREFETILGCRVTKVLQHI
jgi:hypothetical protein